MIVSQFRNRLEHLAGWLHRSRWVPFVEIGTVCLSVAMAIGTYFVLTAGASTSKLLTPIVIALLLLGNLVPAIALLVLIGRRVARGRAARSLVGGEGRLHVRLVAIFSLLAAVPMLLVVVFASILFQVGVEFWFSDRARGTMESAATVAQQSYTREEERVSINTLAMASDAASALKSVSIDDARFINFLWVQLYQRELSEGMVLRVKPGFQIRTLVLVNPYDRDLSKFITQPMVKALVEGKQSVVVPSPNGIGALTKLPIGEDNYIYGARIDPFFGRQMQRAQGVLKDYRDLAKRSRSLQLQFNAALMVIALLIVGVAVWIALTVADRLVRPVGELVDAARKVEAGDLSARVVQQPSRDEIGTLATAFNRMTERLQEQTEDLVTANDQIERRRALIETVLSGVSAGVVSVAHDREVRLINASAAELLATGEISPLGRQLDDVAPELASLLGRGEREAVVQIATSGDARTLAVKVATDEGGYVLTFDDITQQLNDQRRAAWSDVARRIAHEIKNPLTPIQLAAERLKRRYSGEITSDPATFTKLTDTIVRQVGDLRRMVDEFSSFARMPKPLFRRESLTDIARQALFLHEVAHPDLAFSFEAVDDMPDLVCDRRQLGQALTNIIKNAVEAIAQQPGGEAAGGRVGVAVSAGGGLARVIVSDTGVGLPADRERIVEPYMTTRARGTGLGLAIVQKIVEEHQGVMSFADNPGGGTLVTLSFDLEALCALLSDDGAATPSPDPVPAMLTRGRA